MWVYPLNDLPVPQNASPVVPQVPAPEQSAPVQEAALQMTQKAPIRHEKPSRRKAASTEHLFLAGAYLGGTAASGVLQSVCNVQEQEMLQDLLELWQGMFSPSGVESALTLFRTEYIALGGMATLLLLLGFSALGPVCIYLTEFLYGTGNGILIVQSCSSLNIKQILVLFLLGGLPAALAQGCLCLFGAYALRMSATLHRYSFRKSNDGQALIGAKMFLGQYALVMLLLLPLCGVATGLTLLGTRL